MSIVEMPRKFSTLLNPQSSLIMEENKSYTPHDPLFKMLIETFFEKFIEVFFPKFHSEIDFQTVKFLSEEVIANPFKPEQSRLDIVVEAKWRETDSLIIIHVEPQSYVQKGFNERMYYYNCLLYAKYRKPIIPVAIFSYITNA